MKLGKLLAETMDAAYADWIDSYTDGFESVPPENPEEKTTHEKSFRATIFVLRRIAGCIRQGKHRTPVNE